jgi:hypothetical protein
VLDALRIVVGEPHVLKPCFLHACTLCPDGDRPDLVSAYRRADTDRAPP